MRLNASGNQSRRDYFYAADGTIASGGTAQLVLAQSQSRSFLFLQNLSTGLLSFEIGTARATATITNGVVTSVAINNAGFGFTKPPIIRFLGGGAANNGSYLGLNQPDGASPSHIATGRCVLSGGAVASVTVEDGGSGYVIAPYCQIMNSDLDPYGSALPSATSGLFLLNQGDAFLFNASTCPTDPVAVFGATTSQAYACRWMD